MKKKNGFTLVELLAVIVIIAVIAVITTPIIWKYIDDSKKAAYDHQLLEIYKAAELYFTDQSITIENEEKMYVSMNELVASDYLDSLPKDNLHGGKMDGVVEATGTHTNNTYVYFNSFELKDKPSIIVMDSNKTLSNVTINGKTTPQSRLLFEMLADEVIQESTNSERMKLEGYQALVTDSNDIQSVKTEWFSDIFLPNTVYTFSIDSKAIAASSGSTSFHPKMRFVYRDGSKSQEYVIGKHTDERFTNYTYKSDAGKTVRAIEFTTAAESPYRFAYNIETFSLTPDTVAAPYYSKTLKSLGENGIIKLKVVNQNGTVTEKKITLLDPLRSIEGTNITDQIVLHANGSVEVKRRIGKLTLDGAKLSSSNVRIYTGSESTNGYHTFQIDNVFQDRITTTYDIMSDHLPYARSCWMANVDQIGISASPNGTNYTHLYLKVPKSQFPDVTAFLNWLKENPVDIYYEYATPQIETLSSISLNASQIKYIYVDSDLSPNLTVQYK